MASVTFVNGRIFTGTGPDDFTTTFTVTDGVITAVGDASATADEIHDLGGATVLPGLLDVHTHPGLMAALADAVPLFRPVVDSVASLVSQLQTHPNLGAGPDAWIEGYGYNEDSYHDGVPTRHDLDRVSSTQPVVIRRADGHTAVANSRALALAGITRETPDPPLAAFGRDTDGDLTGVLLELNACDRVLDARPPVSAERLVQNLVSLTEHFRSLGIVAVDDLLATFIPDPLAVFRAAEQRGYDLPTALFLGWEPGLPDLSDADRTGRVRVAGTKLFADGAYSNRTAWVEEPYPGTHDHGMVTATDHDLRAAVAWARRNAVQVAVHAMGDGALNHVIDLLADEPGWLADRPSVRLEHATLFTQPMLDRLVAARMNFGVVSHTIFYFAEYDSYATALSPQTAAIAYPIRSFISRLSDFALASDSPATAWNPCDDVFLSVKAAVTRRAYSGADLGQHEAITVGEALHCYTGRAARVTTNARVGTITPGNDAHFVVLDRDVFSVPEKELDQVRVAQTWMHGRLVYQR